MFGAPSHLQGCNSLHLNIDDRNAFRQPRATDCFSSFFVILSVYGHYSWLWRLSTLKGAKQANYLLGSPAGTEPSERHFRYLVLHGVPFGEARPWPSLCATKLDCLSRLRSLGRTRKRMGRPMALLKVSTTTAERTVFSPLDQRPLSFIVCIHRISFHMLLALTILASGFACGEVN